MTKKTRPMTKGDYELLSEFRYQLRRFMRFSEEAVQAEGLTPLQYQLLLQLKGFPGREWATIGELAERLQARHHGVVALVTRCESAGLVRRVTGSVDRRQVEVHLTRKGDQCIARLAGLHRTELRSLSNVFSVENIGAFNDESMA
ncbi:MarR family transcriptional regulator [uncultured Azohydromonas sp.]|uniref:MarR family winged helix-turn-helix transcriptional regulator n=1 Tax=uncultured Azohydromonas sp. TaxID=487342 RepID=UPI00262C2DBB|nr:MarR family transcriptional regulator [uncultured Azohydromonas sp.]